MNTLVFIAIAVTLMTGFAFDIPYAHAKYCNPSGCKGDEGYYTKEGHHHCFEGTTGCEGSNYNK